MPLIHRICQTCGKAFMRSNTKLSRDCKACESGGGRKIVLDKANGFANCQRMQTKSRAAKGGEFGANGEWYEGGKFINTVAENAKRHGSQPKAKPLGKRNVAMGVWEIQPYAGAIALFPQLAGLEIIDRATGLFVFNPELHNEYATPEYIAIRKDRIAKFNSGVRWI
jgi:hypothetical protein